MKKKWKMTFGGLQQKIFNLCLISLLLVLAFTVAFALVQYYVLQDSVTEINDRQKESIGNLSGETMEAVAYESMVEQVGDISAMAEAYFNDCVTYVGLLRDRAAEVYTYNLKAPENVWAAEPKKSDEGTVITQRIYSDTVKDFNDPKLLEDTAALSAMRGIMENIYTRANGTTSKKFTAALGSTFALAPSGVLLISDDHSSNKFDEDGSIKRIPFEKKEWYKKTMESGDFQFSDMTYDTFSDKKEIVVTLPVYVPGDDEIKAIVGVDLFFDAIEDYFVENADSDMVRAMLNGEGEIVFSTIQDGELSPNQSIDLRSDLDNRQLKDLVNRSYEGPIEPERVMYNGDVWIVTTDIVSNMGWPVFAALPMSVVQGPGDEMIKQLDKINDDELDTFVDKQTSLLRCAIIGIVLIIIVVLIGAVYVGTKIVKPLRLMKNRVYALSGTDLAFTMFDELRTKDEIEELAEAFADLSARTLAYISENNKIAAEKERIGTELSLATDIQGNMLPNIFPAFPMRPEIDIFASMDPAKEVGGDFYDFFFVDEDHLALVIADVSGKGVPAALFMMMSKILLNDYTMLVDDSPARILELVNNQICKNNKSRMFVTVWLGILNIKTGRVVCANAGHEYPAVRHGDTYELLKDKHGFMVGARKGKKYTEYEIQLEPGDALFVYTDGVPEATDANQEMYGTDRMLEVLNQNPYATPEELLANVKKSVDVFVGDAPQFDDLTMLNVVYKGPNV